MQPKVNMINSPILNFTLYNSLKQTKKNQKDVSPSYVYIHKRTSRW